MNLKEIQKLNKKLADTAAAHAAKVAKIEAQKAEQEALKAQKDADAEKLFTGDDADAYAKAKTGANEIQAKIEFFDNKLNNARAVKVYDAATIAEYDKAVRALGKETEAEIMDHVKAIYDITQNIKGFLADETKLQSEINSQIKGSGALILAGAGAVFCTNGALRDVYALIARYAYNNKLGDTNFSWQPNTNLIEYKPTNN